MLFHLRLVLQGLDGGADLGLHEIEALGGGAQLILAADRQGRGVIAPRTDLRGGPAEFHQGTQDAAGKDRQHQKQQQGCAEHVQHKDPHAVQIGSLCLLILGAALGHPGVEQLPGVSVYVGRLCF